MTDNNDNIVLEHLRHIRVAVDRNGERLDSVQHRLYSLEQQVAGLRTDFVQYTGEHYSLADRVERIERRLELRDDA